ncbi:MAG: 16S rRNA (cytosine(1402)-N(4))-methyltransferase RsmH, partial [Planctomycetota bacterium]
HAQRIGERLGNEGMLVGIDSDRGAVQSAKKRLKPKLTCNTRFFHGRFSDATSLMEKLSIDGFHVALADLGIGTHQLDDPSRGFSFESEDKLDMRYDTSHGPTAWDVVNETSEKRLADLFYELGEERYSRQIAAKICKQRRHHAIDTPAQLADLIKKIYARRGSGKTWRIHPATRVMMALRIYVNRELEQLEALLHALPRLLVPAGRVAILTYHSLEARRVKHIWRDQEQKGIMKPIPDMPIMPSEKEIGRNPRARSAQLRAAIHPGNSEEVRGCRP